MKGYVIGNIEVTDPQGYEQYRSQTAAIIAAFDGRFLVRGGKVEVREGAHPVRRVVVLEFPSLEQARIFYDSPQYQAVLPHRTDNARSELFLVEGCAPEA